MGKEDKDAEKKEIKFHDCEWGVCGQTASSMTSLTTAGLITAGEGTQELIILPASRDFCECVLANPWK